MADHLQIALKLSYNSVSRRRPVLVTHPCMDYQLQLRGKTVVHCMESCDGVERLDFRTK